MCDKIPSFGGTVIETCRHCPFLFSWGVFPSRRFQKTEKNNTQVTSPHDKSGVFSQHEKKRWSLFVKCKDPFRQDRNVSPQFLCNIKQRQGEGGTSGTYVPDPTRISVSAFIDGMKEDKQPVLCTRNMAVGILQAHSTNGLNYYPEFEVHSLISHSVVAFRSTPEQARGPPPSQHFP